MRKFQLQVSNVSSLDKKLSSLGFDPLIVYHVSNSLPPRSLHFFFDIHVYKGVSHLPCWFALCWLNSSCTGPLRTVSLTFLLTCLNRGLLPPSSAGTGVTVSSKGLQRTKLSYLTAPGQLFSQLNYPGFPYFTGSFTSTFCFPFN